MKKIIIILSVVCIIILFVLYFDNGKNGLEKYVIRDKVHGEIELFIPKETDKMSFEGIHLLMEQSEIEELDMKESRVQGYFYSKNSFQYSTYDEIPAILTGDYSQLSKDEYVDSNGEYKPDYLLKLIHVIQSEDDFFGVRCGQPFHEAANSLLKQNFEYVKGKAQEDTNLIYYEMFNKGDLYIVLINNPSILNLVKRKGVPISKANVVREMEIEIRTGVDDFFIV